MAPRRPSSRQTLLGALLLAIAVALFVASRYHNHVAQAPDAVTSTAPTVTTVAPISVAVQPLPPTARSVELEEEKHHSSPRGVVAAVQNESFARNVPWSEVIRQPLSSLPSDHKYLLESFRQTTRDIPIQICAPEVEKKLNTPALPKADFEWCKWALSTGGVRVGQSWGRLTGDERLRYARLDCNSVALGVNPSCADSWGDEHVLNWRRRVAHNVQCGASSVRCIENEIKDQCCALTRAQIDFRQYTDAPNPLNGKLSKKFTKRFLSIDCAAAASSPALAAFEATFKFDHLFSGVPSAPACDVFLNGTTLLYSHDNARNMGHMYNDILNVWLLLHLEGAAASARHVRLLTVDAMKLYNNFHDQVNAFFDVYRRSFRGVLRGEDFRGQVVCFERLLTQPLPSRGFVWDNWHQDQPCSFVGPSALYQRYSLHFRHVMGLFHKERSAPLRVLLVVRSDAHNEWGSYRSARLMANQRDLVAQLQRFVDSQSGVQLEARDLGKMAFADQLQLVSRASILVGVHGAGLVHMMHMPIGTQQRCCGLLEIFPEGEFSQVRGHGNMARKLGLRYRRLDLPREHSRAEGAHVDPQALINQLDAMIKDLSDERTATCVLPAVAHDPFVI